MSRSNIAFEGLLKLLRLGIGLAEEPVSDNDRAHDHIQGEHRLTEHEVCARENHQYDEQRNRVGVAGLDCTDQQPQIEGGKQKHADNTNLGQHIQQKIVRLLPHIR